MLARSARPEPDKEAVSKDFAIHTWGEDSYNGLGDTLQEGGDVLNGETFENGKVGKDFDFSSQASPDDLPMPTINFAVAASDSHPHHPSQAANQGSAEANDASAAGVFRAGSNAASAAAARPAAAPTTTRAFAMAHALQQQQFHQRTPPHMMPQSQSPRFHLHQQQILLLQKQQAEQQQQRRRQELQDQWRLEEIERQLRAQQLSDWGQGPNYHLNQRPPSGPSLMELQAMQAQQLRRQRSPAGFGDVHSAPNMQNMQRMPHDEQMQRRLLLSEMAQVEFLQNLQGDFITRIQVSQLVTQDPYADDFYAQVYGAILCSPVGLQSQDERVLKNWLRWRCWTGVSSERRNTLTKCDTVYGGTGGDDRQQCKNEREREGPPLTSGRNYKAAPQQLLQIDPNSVGASPTLPHASPQISRANAHPEGAAKEAAKEAAKLGRAALGDAAPVEGTIRKEPLTRRQVLVLLENFYDLFWKWNSILAITHLRKMKRLVKPGTRSVWTNVAVHYKVTSSASQHLSANVQHIDDVSTGTSALTALGPVNIDDIARIIALHSSVPLPPANMKTQPASPSSTSMAFRIAAQIDSLFWLN
ncbi:hypothetical protein FIBSPDRAFT_894912 [Athelia psychrophila]|uniref:mRNA decay factor PAT1 domain-containing protein n=1 Tax=Athelia psychrophila TaxID=1759441 RepID=A0A166FBU2_9AGAM|nr:hypothetical protein FIBSPDRAFT_894912 [Fibularhizoctonia sp. CBS 109695]